MKATELRIGNLVYDTLGKVNKINLDALTYICKEPKNQIKPISLTEEWLLKFGFEITYSSSFRLKFDHNINYEVGFDFSLTENKSMEGFRFYGKYIKIQYVHQLQNLYFALKNEELTII